MMSDEYGRQEDKAALSTAQFTDLRSLFFKAQSQLPE